MHIRALRWLGFSVQHETEQESDKMVEDEALKQLSAMKALSPLLRTEGLLLDEGRVARAQLGDCADPQQLELFIGTWNMGEAEPDSCAALGQWLEPGHDLYVVGVQECLNVDDLQSAILDVLQGRTPGVEWKCWSHSLGSDHTAVGATRSSAEHRRRYRQSPFDALLALRRLPRLYCTAGVCARH